MVYVLIDNYENYIAGYFTSHIDAHKYAAIHNNNFDVVPTYNLGDTTDLSDVSVKFKWYISFYYDKTNDKWYECHDTITSMSNMYTCYTGDMQQNEICLRGSETYPLSLQFAINTESCDWNLALGIANDLLDDLLKRGSGHVLRRNINQMIDEFATAFKERQRLKEEEELREKELAELARLKEKYENHE